MINNLVIKASVVSFLTLMADGISQDHIEDVTILGGMVIAIIGITAWIDSRIKKAINDHAAVEEQWNALVLEKIGNLHEQIKELKGAAE